MTRKAAPVSRTQRTRPPRPPEATAGAGHPAVPGNTGAAVASVPAERSRPPDRSA